MSYNKVIMMGRLGKDADSRAVNDSTVLTFSIAVDSFNSIGGKTTTTTDWFNCEYWCKDNRLSFMKSVLLKGTQVLVEGTLRQEVFTTREGTKKDAVKIRVRDLEVVTRASGADDDLPV